MTREVENVDPLPVTNHGVEINVQEMQVLIVTFYTSISIVIVWMFGSFWDKWGY